MSQSEVKNRTKFFRIANVILTAILAVYAIGFIYQTFFNKSIDILL